MKVRPVIAGAILVCGFGMVSAAQEPPPDIGYEIPAGMMPMPPIPPAPPAHPVVHEYQWRDANHPGAVLFVATKDGKILTAVAVCVQEGSVYLTAPDGKAKSIPLTWVDRDLTRRLNEEARLRVWLP